MKFNKTFIGYCYTIIGGLACLYLAKSPLIIISLIIYSIGILIYIGEPLYKG